jgi:toxin ParE1/3/4
MRVIFSRTAARDYVAIIEYLTLLSRPAGKKLTDRFDSLFRRLGRFPESGAVCYHVSSYFRSISLDEYVVYYHIESDHVRIDRILHGAQDAGPQLKDM